jgi:hypothetical protein
MTSSPFASRSVRRHYARGALGLLAAVGGVLGAALGVPAAIALLLVTLAAWRGCPTCWAIGLMHTREACADGRCSTAR